MQRISIAPEEARRNLLERLLRQLFPNMPWLITLILTLVRLFGYGILIKWGIDPTIFF